MLFSIDPPPGALFRFVAVRSSSGAVAHLSIFPKGWKGESPSDAECRSAVKLPGVGYAVGMPAVGLGTGCGDGSSSPSKQTL